MVLAGFGRVWKGLEGFGRAWEGLGRGGRVGRGGVSDPATRFFFAF